MDMNPQDQADFTGLSCWVLAEGEISTPTADLLKSLNIKPTVITLPQGFKQILKAKVLGPFSVIPHANFPSVLIVEVKKGYGLMRFIKQRSPATFAVSLFGKKFYADIDIPADPAHPQMVLGHVRGSLLRHLTLHVPTH